MKNKNKYKLLILICCIFINSCNQNNNDKSTEINKTNERTNKIVIWGYYNSWEKIAKNIEREFPRYTIEFKNFESDSLDEILKAIESNDYPDIITIENIYLNKLIEKNCLENLFEITDKSKGLSELYQKGELSLTMSFDRKNIFAVPIIINPKVLYYRNDLMKKFGFPYEPDEFGVYIENKDNFYEVVKKLKENDSWFVTSAFDQIMDLTYNANIFDAKMNLERNYKKYGELFEIYRRFEKENYNLESNIWSNIGQNDFQSDKFGMIIGGIYLDSYLNNNMDQSTYGKWKVSKLPLNLSAYGNYFSVGILKKSKNSKIAYEVLEEIINLTKKEQEDGEKEKNEFLGDQYKNKFVRSLSMNFDEVYNTPIDEKVKLIWRDYVSKYLSDDSIKTKELFERFQDDVTSKFKDEINQIKSNNGIN